MATFGLPIRHTTEYLSLIVILTKSWPSLARLVMVPQQFNMPFRLLAHPNNNWVYVSDIGNQRIHILQYDDKLSIRSIHCFGDEADVDLKGPPNGIAFYQGELCVADEFFEGGEGGELADWLFSLNRGGVLEINP